MKSNLSKEEIRNKLQALRLNKTETQLIQREALILQANYLSEIERLTKEKGLSRKDIALNIKTTPSYLTQVFRGDKPLNFITLAKIKRALGLRFDVSASFASEKTTEKTTVGVSSLTNDTEKIKVGSYTDEGGHMITEYVGHRFILYSPNENKLLAEA